MGIKQTLKTMLNEAEIYRAQGLMAEAHAKYRAASELIESIDGLKNKDSLVNAISEKIKAVDDTKKKVEDQKASPKLSKKAQDLIKNLFTFTESKDADAAALEGAVILAKFGQFDRALTDLRALLQREGVRVEAAKNILRCHLAIGPAEAALKQYDEWFKSGAFPPGQLDAVRHYLLEILQKKGMPADLASPLSATTSEALSAELEIDSGKEQEEEFLDITSIGITFDHGPTKGRVVEFDVNFQSGNMLSLIIPKKDHEIIEGLQSGTKLKDVQFYSPIAIFSGVGVVSSKTEIKSGPKQGDFCLDIRIAST